MEKLKALKKDGYHPKGKNGGKESWRGDFKGINQVAGWMGKSTSSTSAGADDSEHVSRPLHTLKDPSSFGPPPKHVHYHGGAAVPERTTPDTGGWGAPLGQDHVQRTVQEKRQEQDDADRPKPPPVPYRVDTTGLKAEGLPLPPRRMTEPPGNPARTTSPMGTSVRGGGVGPGGKPKAKPILPPRLPPRDNKTTGVPDSPPPAYETGGTASTEGLLNQGAMNRLGAAGINVPGLGIGSNANNAGVSTTATAGRTVEGQAQGSRQGAGAMSELQARFSRLNGGAAARTEGRAGETSGAPSSVAVSSAVSSAASFMQQQASKKPPPPAPPRKNFQSGQGQTNGVVEVDERAPPPVPLASKPR